MPTQEELLAKAERPSHDALLLHPYYRGKIQMLPKCPIRGYDDFSIWYTPGVAACCRAIQRDPQLVWEHTNRANCVAIVSDGSRVLGLGDIGPEAGLPVMEGKALLFKYLGGVDAVPICLRTGDAEDLVRIVKALAPSFGGINLEDISQPKCFDVLDTLRKESEIPVWHDDQQGTATVAVAGLMNALEVVGKRITEARIRLIGVGAANVATYRLLLALGVNPGAIVACDSSGTLHRGRADLEAVQDRFRDKWAICQQSNDGQVTGGIEQALAGADVCIAFSKPGPNVIRAEWIRKMAADAIVMVCANPIPEIWPWEAKEAGARIVATGRGDFPNQVNNSLGFPAIFRGALDVRARTITDRMALAAASELAAAAREAGIHEERIVPRMDDWQVYIRVAVATGLQAQRDGVACLTRTEAQLNESATAAIESARNQVHVLMKEGLIPAPPN